MKRKFIFGLVATSLATTSLLTTACDSENDIAVSNPEQALLDQSWASKFGQIDPNQDWSLATTAKANISVNGLDALAEYQLQLYTENPITSSNALLMASKKVTTDAAGAAEAKFTVDIVKGSTVYYACYMDKDNRRSAKPVALIDGTIDAQFGTAAPSAAKAMSRAGSSTSDGFTVDNAADPTEVVMAKYDQAKEVSDLNKDQNWDGSENYTTVMKISDSWNGNISVVSSEGAAARTLYVDGTWTLNGEQRLGGSGLIVVRNGGKIVIPSGSHLLTANGGRIVVLDGGKIEGAGTITFANGSGNSYDYIAAGAEVNIGALNNNGGKVFNYGLLQANEIMGGAGLSEYYNHNKMIIDHSTYGSSSANTRIYNACKLEAANSLCCKIIKMSNPSYTHVGGNLLMSGAWDGTSDDAEIVMAANAQLKVDGGVALNNANIVGPTSGYAVCEFGKIGDSSVATNYTTTWSTGKETLSAGYVINNLYISIEETETIDQYYTLSDYGKFIMIMLNGRLYDVVNNTTPQYRAGVQAGNGNAVIVEKGQANVNIPGDGCVEEYNPEPGPDPDPEPNAFIIACEDLGSTNDVDYNDVVFSVSHVAGQKYITIKPLAAGGTLAANIYYGSQPVGEIHSMLGVSDTKTMINTTSQTPTNVGTPVTIEVADENWDFASNYRNFKVQVTTNENESKFVTAPAKGTAPFMIVVPGDWQWPLERVNIEIAYPNFTDWSQNAAENNSWTSKKAASKTVKR